MGFLFALWGVTPRWRAESQHQTTEILLDGPALSQWEQSVPSASVLREKLTSAGVRSLAFPELHLDELVDRGLVVAQSGSEFELTIRSGALGSTEVSSELDALLSEPVAATYLIFKNSQLASQLAAQLKILHGDKVQSLLDGRVVRLPLARKDLRTAGLGFDSGAIEGAAEQGFSIWLRPENRAGISEKQIVELFASWEQLPGVQGVIFGGAPNEAMGYPVNLEATAKQLERLKWKVGYIELPPKAQQKGIETMVRQLPHRAVRVMAVSPMHQAKLSPFRVLGMYSLGSRERNLRVLYVRPYGVPGRPELDEEFLFKLEPELENSGAASVFQANGTPGASPFLTAALGFCGAALGLLILQELGVATRMWWFAVLLVPVVAGFAAGVIGKGLLYRSLLALAISVAAPTFAFLRWVYPLIEQPTEKTGLFAGLKALVISSLISVTAGLYLAALLSDTTFLLGLDRFRGVKLLTLGAPVLIVLCFLLKKYSVEQWLTGLRSYVAVYQAALAGGMLLVLGLLYLRTGNQAGGTATDTERTLRVILDKTLGVRPRFKEFMLAHPAMVCAPLFSLKTGFLPALVLVLLAGIGQAGIVDTFAHIHTPLDVTLIRVGLGVVLGAVVGSIAIGAFRIVEPVIERFRGYYKKGGGL